jgi:uncharacterized membrane protein YfcA
MLTPLDYVLIALAGAGGGLVNAIAGGGTLITFPALTALGVPAVLANVTSTVALCPGYLGATLAQARDLEGQRGRLVLLVPAALAGGVAGALLLLASGEKLFRDIVPFLILSASLLLAMQERVRAWVARRQGAHASARSRVLLAVGPVAVACVYGGYFGAGLSVVVLAVLGALLDDTLTRLNGLKQALALAANVAAAVVFASTGSVPWGAALVMAAGALAGGALGGRVAARLPPAALRRAVVTLGVAVALLYMW